VCGKLFSGRSKTTPAYTHSLDTSHHVFMKLTDGDGRSTHELRTCPPPLFPPNFSTATRFSFSFLARSYCLPDNYEVLDASVNDVRAVLRPRYRTLSFPQ
jgi:U4/U6.U5 tri-snRNP-associated protein 2